MQIALRGLKIANRRFEGIHANRSHFMKIVFLFFQRVDSRGSTRAKPEVEGSGSYQSSVTPSFQGTKAPKTPLLCFGANREGRMIQQRGEDDPWPIWADFLNP